MKIVQSHLKTLRIQTKHKLSGVDENIQNLVDKMIRLDRDERLDSYEVVIDMTEKLLVHLSQKKTSNKVILARRAGLL